MEKPEVIIDAGHGGKDPGAVGKLFHEEDWTLQTSVYMLDRFTALGIPAELTRDKDVDVELNARAKMVRKSGARVCISNHVNAGGGTGAEVIVSLYSNRVWGGLVLEELKAAGAGSRKVYSRESETMQGKDYYAMHRQTGTVETIIVEYGFIDSADAPGLLENWKRYAEAVIKATCKYLSLPYSPPVGNTMPAKTSRPYGIPEGLADYQVSDFLDLVDDKLITSPEEWGPKLPEPAPLWFVCAMINRIRKE